MNDGTISGNTVLNTSSGSANGGGVYSVATGTFTMKGGTIYGSMEEPDLANTAESGASLYSGGTANYGDDSPISLTDSATDETLEGHM
jgi:hypothetical protein